MNEDGESRAGRTNEDGTSRDELAHEANEVRSKLMHTIEQLDRRRHDAVDFRLQVRRHARQIVAMGVLSLVLAAGGGALVVYRISTAATRRRRNRWRFVRGVWRHPDRALRAGRGPFYIEALRSLGLSLLTLVLTFPARRLVLQILRPGSPGGIRVGGSFRGRRLLGAP